MSKVKEQRTWTTDDGSEFPTEAEANRHAEFVAAHDAYETAKRRYGALLAERQKTADGHPFKFSILRDYWYVVEYIGETPRLGRVGFYLNNCTVDDDDCIVITNRERIGEEYKRYRIDHLYAVEANARQVLLDRLNQYTAELRQVIEELRAKAAR